MRLTSWNLSFHREDAASGAEKQRLGTLASQLTALHEGLGAPHTEHPSHLKIQYATATEDMQTK